MNHPSATSTRIVKALGIFSSVQMVSVVCSVIRTKIIALWLGPMGVGVYGMLFNAYDMISNISRMGIQTSAVRDIASLPNVDLSSPHLHRISYIVSRWGLYLGICGAIATIGLSPWLSEASFGDTGHTFQFVILAIAVMFNCLVSARQAITQGAGMLSQLAKASLIGAVGGLIVAIPLYWFIGIDSISAAIAAYSIITYLALRAIGFKVRTPEPKPTMKDTLGEGKSFIRLGFLMTISVAMTSGANYLFLSWLNHRSDTNCIGMYQAGYTIVTQYLGFIFTAIMMEYYPRMAAVSTSRWRSSVFASHEIYLTAVILLPVSLIMMGADSLIINLLYNKEFLAASMYTDFALAGTIFRAASWCMAVAIIARGDGKTYIITESLSTVLFLALNIMLWPAWGMAGLGIAYTIWYFLYLIITGYVYLKKYKLTIRRNTTLFIAFASLLTCICAVMRHYGYIIPIVLAAIPASVYALRAGWLIFVKSRADSL